MSASQTKSAAISTSDDEWSLTQDSSYNMMSEYLLVAAVMRTFGDLIHTTDVPGIVERAQVTVPNLLRLRGTTLDSVFTAMIPEVRELNRLQLEQEECPPRNE